MTSSRPMTWTADATLDLFACLLNEQLPSQGLARSVAERMSAMGYTCTAKAITHQFAKIRQREQKENKKTTNDDNIGGSGGSSSQKNNNKKKRAVVEDSEDRCNDHEEKVSPPPPKNPRHRRARIKEEQSVVPTVFSSLPAVHDSITTARDQYDSRACGSAREMRGKTDDLDDAEYTDTSRFVDSEDDAI